MKRLLSFLLCIVFLQVQTAGLYAKRGGPDIGNGGAIEITGTYAGVLIPRESDKDTKALNGDVINAIGIFSLSAPRVGPATGAFLLFAEGVIFDGTITAVGDPGKGTLTGMVDAAYEITAPLLDDAGNPILDPDTNEPVTQTIQKNLVGRVQCDVVNTGNLSVFNPLAFLYSQRLEGKAEMGAVVIGPDGELALETVDVYTVDGVRQSPEVEQVGFGGGIGGGIGGGGIVVGIPVGFD